MLFFQLFATWDHIPLKINLPFICSYPTTVSMQGRALSKLLMRNPSESRVSVLSVGFEIISSFPSVSELRRQLFPLTTLLVWVTTCLIKYWSTSPLQEIHWSIVICICKYWENLNCQWPVLKIPIQLSASFFHYIALFQSWLNKTTWFLSFNYSLPRLICDIVSTPN